MSTRAYLLLPMLSFVLLAGGRSVEFRKHPAAKTPVALRKSTVELHDQARAPRGLRPAPAASQYAAPAEIELSNDDGSPDGWAILEDGLMLVTRLTPRAYPIEITKIRIYFVSVTGQPDPAGKQIRLVLFADPEGKGVPPSHPKLLVDKTASVPATGKYVDFAVNGPVITSGDLYAGYQAPQPANGVGFATDTNGAQKQRCFQSADGGATFGGPVEFADGTRLNAMIRAVGTIGSGAGVTSEELAIDDETAEGALLRSGGMYVNRLTPSKYPAHVDGVRLYFVSVTGSPSPVDRSIRLVVFRDPEGKGAPPASPKFDVDRNVTITATGAFLDFATQGPDVESGDIYVGYQAPDPHSGVGFALDTTSPADRSFRSTDGGKTFNGPLEVTFDGGATYVGMNLMMRAVVTYSAPEPATFELTADRESLDLSEGPASETFRVSVYGGKNWEGAAHLAVRTEPPNIPVNLAVKPDAIRAGEQAEVTVSGLQSFDGDSFRVIVTGEVFGSTARLEVPADRWRLIQEQGIDNLGGTLAGGGFVLRVPAQAFAQPTALRLYTGKPPTGLEDYHASEIFRVEGLPENFEGTLDVQFNSSPKANSVLAASADPPPVMALMQKKAGPGGAVANSTKMVSATTASGGAIDAKKLKLQRSFTMWMLKGYYAAATPSGRFIIYYPLGFADAAASIGADLEQAADLLESEGVGVYFTLHSGVPIPVTLRQLRDTVSGDSDDESIRYNTLRLGTPEQIAAFHDTPGHELMHFAQGQYGGNAPWSSAWYKTYPWYWMDEALSTWFEPFAMKQPGHIPTTVCPNCGTGTNTSDNYRTFALQGLAKPPGTAADQDHGYGASMFLTMAYRGDERLVSKLIHGRTPSESAVDALARAVGGPTELARLWSQFGNEYFAGIIYPGRRFPALSDLATAGEDIFRPFVTETDDWKRFAWIMAPELALCTFNVAFNAAANIPDLTDEVMMQAKILEGYDDVDLHAWAYDAKESENLGKVSGSTPLVFPAVKDLAAKRRTVMLGVVNNKLTSTYDSTRNISVRVELADPTVKIYPDFSTMKGVIGYAYDFSTKNRNIPPDAQYQWDFGDGGGSTGRTVKHSFKAAGQFRVEVTATLLGKAVKDSIVVTIAPDTPTKKSEVLFEVYRRLKTSVGTSNQMCNNYSIAIADSTGKLVESGESVAKNGAYEAVLLVANGYKYTVNYGYTTPCADNGKVTGTFDVKDTSIQGVRIETPPCEK